MKIKLGIFLFLGIVLGGCNFHEEKTDIPGCMDPASINFKSDATVDDGTCLVPQQKQIGFVINYTATWCAPCGASGAPALHAIYDLGDVVAITCHADGDPMYNSTLYSSFSSGRPTGGSIPSFWVGDLNNGDMNKMLTLKNRVPEAGVTFVSEIVGNKLEVKSLTQFFATLSGDFYLSVYLLESGIDGSASAGSYKQNGTSDPDYKHDFVLRAVAVGTAAYGEKIASGNIQEGTTIRKDYSITIDPAWTQHVYAAAILWKKNESTGFYEFLNAFEAGDNSSH